jgi:predicted permease
VRRERAERWFRRILAVYPAEFRRRYGAEMEDAFRSLLTQEARLHGRVRWVVVWMRTLWDAGVHGTRLRWGTGGADRREGPGAGAYRADRGGRDVVGSLIADVRYAVRALRRKPVFALTAVGTLALGIGANTSIFNIVNGLLIRDMPYERPDELVHIWSQNLERGWFEADIPLVDAWDFGQRTSAFVDVAVYDRRSFTLTGTDRPERMAGRGVTPNMFSVLGVFPDQGRNFTDADGQTFAPAVAILSHGFWQQRLGGDPGALGTTIHLDGEPTTIIGVMPAGFPFIDSQPDVWVPFRGHPADARRGNHSHVAVARLAPGVTVDRARRDVAQVALALQEEHPETNRGWTADVISMQLSQLGDIGARAALVMMSAVGFVLLMACTNVANLLLARANGRRLEMAIRSAMGAGRGRMLRQTLIESLVLSSIGGVLGGLLAIWGTGVIVRGLPSNLPPIFTFEMDGTVLAFTAAVSVVAALLFGLAPAVRSSRLTGSELRDGGRSGPGARGRRFGGFLVVAQTALAVVLLVGGGVMVRSVMGMARLDLGYEAAALMTFSVSPGEARYEDKPAVTAVHDDLVERITAIPAVEGAGAVYVLPLSGSNTVGSFVLEGEDPSDPVARYPARFNYVSPGYFETMGIARIAGRAITLADDADAPPVVVVNETLVSRHFGDGNAVGRRLVLDGTLHEVVGVVADHFERSLADPIQPGVYFPIRRFTGRTRTVVVRTSGDPAALVPILRSAVLEMDGDLPIYGVQPMVDNVTRAVGPYYLMAKLMGGFALISLLLGAVGIYGVMSYGVGQRTNEIGVRMALGAARRQVRGMVVRTGMRRAALGIGCGLALAFGVTRAMSSLLVGVSPTDPLVFGGVTALLLAVAFLGSYLPALRASAVNPVDALSQE